MCQTMRFIELKMEQICYYLVNIKHVARLSRTPQNRLLHPRLRTTALNDKLRIRNNTETL